MTLPTLLLAIAASSVHNEQMAALKRPARPGDETKIGEKRRCCQVIMIQMVETCHFLAVESSKFKSINNTDTKINQIKSVLNSVLNLCE